MYVFCDVPRQHATVDHDTHTRKSEMSQERSEKESLFVWQMCKLCYDFERSTFLC